MNQRPVFFMSLFALVLGAGWANPSGAQAQGVPMEQRYRPAWFADENLANRLPLRAFGGFAGPIAPGQPRKLYYAVIYDTAGPREDMPAYQRTVGIQEFDCQGQYRVLHRDHEMLDGRRVGSVAEPSQWWSTASIRDTEALVCGDPAGLPAGTGLDRLTARYLQARGKPAPPVPGVLGPQPGPVPARLRSERWTTLGANQEQLVLLDTGPATTPSTGTRSLPVAMVASKFFPHNWRYASGQAELDCANLRIRIGRTDSVGDDNRLDESHGTEAIDEWTRLPRDNPIARMGCEAQPPAAVGLGVGSLPLIAAHYLHGLREQGHDFIRMPQALEFCAVSFANNGRLHYIGSTLRPIETTSPLAGMKAWAARRHGAPSHSTDGQCYPTSGANHAADRDAALANFHRAARIAGQEAVVITETWHQYTH